MMHWRELQMRGSAPEETSPTCVQDRNWRLLMDHYDLWGQDYTWLWTCTLLWKPLNNLSVGSWPFCFDSFFDSEKDMSPCKPENLCFNPNHDFFSKPACYCLTLIYWVLMIINNKIKVTQPICPWGHHYILTKKNNVVDKGSCLFHKYTLAVGQRLHQKS